MIVVDGGSRDVTLLIGRLLADRAFAARPGRAMQMNAGAQRAAGDMLLFLHADSVLPADAAIAIARAVAGGATGALRRHDRRSSQVLKVVAPP